MSRAPWFALAVLTFLLAGAFDANAELVVVVKPDPSDSLLFDAWNRLAAELKIHDFEVESVEPTEEEAPGSALAQIADKERAIAAIALVRHGRAASVDVWLVDRASGKTTLRTIVVAGGNDAASVLAIRAVDLLRASLQEFPEGEQPPKDVAGVDRRAPTPALVAFRAPPEHRVRLRADALLFVQDRAGFAVGPSLGVSYRLGDRVELGVAGAGPLVAGRVTTPLGSATLQQGMAWCDLRFDVIAGRSVSAGVNAALGAYFLRAEGEPRQPLQSKSGGAAAALGAIGVHAEAAIFPDVAVGVAARVLGLLPRVGIAVGDASSVLGQPAVMTTAGIRVAL